MLKVYVAAPYADGPDLRTQLVDSGALAKAGAECTSRWLLEHPGEPENFDLYSLSELEAFARQNDEDLRAADVVLLVDPKRRGRETYAEVARAIAWGKQIVWVGPPTLSFWRSDARVHLTRDVFAVPGVLRRLPTDPVTVFDEAFRGCTWPTGDK